MTDPVRFNYYEGLIVLHPRKPEWGPGRVLAVQGSQVIVYFRDLPGNHPEDAVRKIDTKFVSLNSADNKSDLFLANLPPYADGRFQRPLKKRVTLEEGIKKFQSYCPLFFEDPAYIGNLKSGERTYKWEAHRQFVETLGGDQLEHLLAAGAIASLRDRALAVEGRVNLLAVFEKAAFRDGLRSDAAAVGYFNALLAILKAPTIEQASFEEYLHAVDSLPSKEGKTSPAKWTVATVLPYLAQPDRFMFLKPEVTQDCAARLTFDLGYRPQLNWLTYAKLLEMSHLLLEELRPYGARDFIDVQSFIWLIGGGWDN